MLVVSCPFCANTPVVWEEKHGFRIGCEPCNYALGYFDTEDDALFRWNQRPKWSTTPTDDEARE